MMNKTRRTPSGYPNLVTELPEAIVPFEGARAWIFQGEGRQLVFFEFEAGIKLPAHSHLYVQWGMVIDGDMELTIAGEPRRCRKGDEYLVPAGALHGATFFAKTRVMDFFSEKARYQAKSA